MKVKGTSELNTFKITGDGSAQNPSQSEDLRLAIESALTPNKLKYALQVGDKSEVVAVIVAINKEELKSKVVEALKDSENLVDAEITQDILEGEFQVKCIEKHNDYEITAHLQEVVVY